MPGQFFMLEAPGRVLPRPMCLCLAPPGELGFLIDPIGPGHARALRVSSPARSCTSSARSANGFELDRDPAAARRRRHRRRAAPVPLGGARPAARHPRLPLATGTPRRRRSCRTPRSCVEPTLVTERAARRPGDVLACGPEPMLEAVRALVPGAQLAWEAPMACGYGACYGCVVEHRRRAAAALRRGAGAPGGMMTPDPQRVRLPRRADGAATSPRSSTRS